MNIAWYRERERERGWKGQQVASSNWVTGGASGIQLGHKPNKIQWTTVPPVVVVVVAVVVAVATLGMSCVCSDTPQHTHHTPFEQH